jgi:hypothetical protein
MRNSRACALIRLLHVVLLAWALSIAHRAVEQFRFERLGVVGWHMAVFDRLYGEPILAPLPVPPDDDMIIPRSTN